MAATAALVQFDIDAASDHGGHEPVLLVEPNGLKLITYNAAATTLYGSAHPAFQSMVYRDLLDRSVPETGPGALPGTERSPERHVRHDGATIQVLRVHRPVLYNGSPALLVTLVDVSDKVEAEARTRRERCFFERIVHALPAAIFVKDLHDEARYVLCTRPSEDMANLPHNSIVGAIDADLFSSRVAESFAASDLEVQRTGGMLTTENTFCHTDGRVVVTETRKLTVPDDDGAARYVLGITEDISQRREMELRLAHVAMHDPLTGLANRTLFRERLRAALARREEKGGFVILHLLDLDHFKGINDTLGHAAGDQLLREVAARIATACGPMPAIARLGGDEFAVIQGPVETAKEALDLAERIGSHIGQPVEIAGRLLVVGSSAGLAIAPDHGKDPEIILRNADIALYGSKSDSRGSYRFFDGSLAAEVQRRHSLDEDLREALANQQFELYYQPIIDIAQDRVVSFEALLRWRHPTRGFVGPAEFVPVAEETGIIVRLGEWVLQEACRQAAAWHDPIGISVNLSPVQFRHPGLAASVMLALEAAGLAPDRLELEITESVLLSNNATNLATLHQLRALGIRISLDDFGTGYSSLGYLSAFPFNKIKIDRSFVQDIGSAATCLAIVRSVIRLAEDLGMTATAEGVETAEQLDQLRAEGCTQAQGFLFDRPRPADNVPAMVQRLRENSSLAA